MTQKDAHCKSVKCKSKPQWDYYFTHTTVPTIIGILKTGNNKYQNVEKLELFVYCWWECKMTQPLWKIFRSSSKKKKKKNIELPLVVVQSISHVQLFATPKNFSTPGFPVLHYLPKIAQIHDHWLSWWCHPTISSSVAPFSCPHSLSQYQGLF